MDTKTVYGKTIYKKDVGNRIFKIRKQRNETLEEFGRLFGASKGNVLKWENGSISPNKSRIEKIAEIGGITIGELLHGPTEEITKIQALEEIEEILVKLKKISKIAGIDFGEHFEAIYNQWRLEYGRERMKENDGK